jgi:hypothetical protein
MILIKKTASQAPNTRPNRDAAILLRREALTAYSADMIKLTRVAPGFYVTTDQRYEVARAESGEWYWNKAGKPADDVFRTKGDAVEALNAFVAAWRLGV